MLFITNIILKYYLFLNYYFLNTQIDNNDNLKLF